jgi:phospholipid/cholesterol/gamma-HCH transport system substrate-binding protein
MRNTLETRLGVFVALAVIAAVLVLELSGGTQLFRRGYRLNGLFNQVQDLKKGDRVKMAGVDIGYVEKLDLEEQQGRVRVQMKLKRGVEVRTDSVATIKFTGLMGQNYVAIDFGSPGSPLLTDGQNVATAETPDFGAVIAKIDNVATGVENLTKSFTGDRIDNLLGPFTDFLKANQVPLTATIANIRSISDQISEGKGTVGKLIHEDALYTSTLGTVTNLEQAAIEAKTTLADARKVVDQANSVMTQVNAGQGTVGKLLKDERLYNDTADSMRSLKEVIQKVNQGQGSVSKLLNDRELYNNAKLTLQKLDKATEGLEDQGPLSVMGLLINSLF